MEFFLQHKWPFRTRQKLCLRRTLFPTLTVPKLHSIWNRGTPHTHSVCISSALQNKTICSHIVSGLVRARFILGNQALVWSDLFWSGLMYLAFAFWHKRQVNNTSSLKSKVWPTTCSRSRKCLNNEETVVKKSIVVEGSWNRLNHNDSPSHFELVVTGVFIPSHLLWN